MAEGLDATTQILSAIERLDGKVDGLLLRDAGHVEWRKHVEAEIARYATRIDVLEERDRDREISIVRIMAWSAGAGGVASLVVSIGVAVAIKLLTGH
jgi:hypothetical protein